MWQNPGMGRDIPPQTIAEALDFGWTALAFVCDRRACGHQGRIEFASLPQRMHCRPLASLFARCVCGKCGARPSYALLATACIAPDGREYWEEKKVDFHENLTLRPSRE